MTSCFGKKIFTSHFLAIFLLVSLNCLGNFTFEKNARALFSKNQLDLSLAKYKRAIELSPESTHLKFEYGNALFLNGQFEEAKQVFNGILFLNPTHYESLIKIGDICVEKNNVSDAIAIFENLKSFIPDNANLHYSLAQAYLATGEYKKGFEEYEWRKKLYPIKDDNLNIPDWNGESLEGQTLLIYTEMGFGDIVQFGARYALKAKAKGAKVILRLHNPRLKEILSKACPYIEEITTIDEPTPHADYKVRLMSLMKHFGTTVDDIPKAKSYIYPDKTAFFKWKEFFKNDQNIKIGLCWKGASYPSPEQHFFTKKRSFPLEIFAPLKNIDGISLYCLDSTISEKDLETGVDGFVVKKLPTEDKPYIDTVEIIANLDIIITIDTSIAHMAGALGVPTWVLLPSSADWRWFADERRTSPWYQNTILFRQSTIGDWTHPIINIIETIEQLIELKTTRDKTLE
ncbi:tetratricopeptide repeat protein [bacterium]|nr:tetratricopeptide repeat protein [bacterium]